MDKFTDRDKLIKLLSPFADGTYNGSGTIIDGTKVDDVVNSLLANGVIVPPCKVGDKVYYVHETLWDNDYKNKVISESVKKRILKIVERPKHFTNLALEILTFDYCFITDWLKGNIFLTKEGAEEKLKELGK